MTGRFSGALKGARVATTRTTQVCTRCGIERNAHGDRRARLCADCRAVERGTGRG